MNEYGMFTEQGNIAVASIVAYHAYRETSTPELIVKNMEDLAAYNQMFAEATDTVVREAVLTACGY